MSRLSAVLDLMEGKPSSSPRPGNPKRSRGTFTLFLTLVIYNPHICLPEIEPKGFSLSSPLHSSP